MRARWFLRSCLALSLLLGLLRILSPPWLTVVDARLRDQRLLSRGEEAAADEVVIVAIDDASLERFGRWPWPRSLQARLLEAIGAAEPAVIGFDIVQSESTTPPDLELLRRRAPELGETTWRQLAGLLGEGGPEDAELVRAVAESGRVVLGYFFDFAREQGMPQPGPGLFNLVQVRDEERAQALRHLPPRPIEVPLAVTNLPALEAAAAGNGFFNLVPDRDGVVRRLPLAVRYGDDVAVPLALAMLRRVHPERPLRLALDGEGVVSLHWGGRAVPVDRRGEMLLNYRGRAGSFATLSAGDVLEGKADPERWRGRIVLVGVTANAVYDLRVTPFSGAFPGVEIHATALDNLLHERFLRQPWWGPIFEVSASLALPWLLGALLLAAPGAVGAGGTLLAAVAWLGVSQWAFTAGRWSLSVLHPLLALGVTYAVISVQQFVFEARERRRMRRALELYLSPSLAAILSERPETLSLGGERRECTVLFSDIQGFTALSERLEPEAVVDLLNEYLGAMTAEVFRVEGMLDKYIGDGIMAVWGVPLAQPDHALRACRAALAMQERLAALRPRWQARGWPEIRMRIGLHTGPVVFGNLGSADHLSLTVVGDNVNLAARLEGLNKDYATEIILSEATLAAAGPALAEEAGWREIDVVQVKGREEPVRVHQLLPRSASGGPPNLPRQDPPRSS